jgi:uncharacterized protein
VAVWLALSTLACGLSGCAWWETKQRVLAFRPTPGTQPADFTGFKAGDKTYFVTVPGSDQRVAMWWLPHADPQAPTVLYLHGTFRNLYRNSPKIDALRAAGFAVVAVDYRGWGESTPIVPSEASVYADAELAWAELARYQPVPALRVIYGHSMGGGVAVEMAHRRRHGQDYGALIVEASFTSWPDVAASLGVVGTIISWSAVDKFDSIGKIGQIDAPVLILHGSLDNTVPVRMGQRLRDAAPPGTRYVEIANGSHSRLFSDAPEEYQAALRELKDRLLPGPLTPASRQAVPAVQGSSR